MNKAIGIIVTGFILFAIPALDLYYHCPNQVYNWHRCLHWYGWIGFIGFLICFVLVIREGLNIQKRNRIKNNFVPKARHPIPPPPPKK